ncbi:peptidylprolyl isomerase [Myxococcota bacterium]|nr:peptidylprolyl isomerase [Myxococcota bacterium]
MAILVALAASVASVASAEEDVLSVIDAFIADEPIDDSDPRWRIELSPPPILPFDESKTYYWDLETDDGSMRFELFPDLAPMHVSSLIYLTRLGFYDGLTFHRIIPGFMAQGGDPTGTGAGSPGYLMKGEFPEKDRRAKHSKRGILSAANRGPNTDGSQFFITFKSIKQLNGKHTVYGQMVEGKKTLRALEKKGTRKGKPRDRVEILAAVITIE